MEQEAIEFTKEVGNYCVQVKFLPDNINIDIVISLKDKSKIVLVWRVQFESLFILHFFDGLLNSLPEKLSTALQTNSLMLGADDGIHFLASLTFAVEAILDKSKYSNYYFAINRMSSKLKSVIEQLKGYQLKQAIRLAEELLHEMTQAKIACHIYIEFIFGELYRLRETKTPSSVDKETWDKCFQSPQCLNLLETFRSSLAIGTIIQDCHQTLS
jgi:hypothetical protein